VTTVTKTVIDKNMSIGIELEGGAEVEDEC